MTDEDIVAALRIFAEIRAACCSPREVRAVRALFLKAEDRRRPDGVKPC